MQDATTASGLEAIREVREAAGPVAGPAPAAASLRHPFATGRDLVGRGPMAKGAHCATPRRGPNRRHPRYLALKDRLRNRGPVDLIVASHGITIDGMTHPYFHPLEHSGAGVGGRGFGVMG